MLAAKFSRAAAPSSRVQCSSCSRTGLRAVPSTTQHLLPAIRHRQQVGPLPISRRISTSTRAAAAATDPAPVEVYDPSALELKSMLLDSIFGTGRGLAANSETRAEINELITQLEAKNPTPQPNEALNLLDGQWKLVYTASSDVIALLSLGRLPFVTVGDITQSIDGATQTVTNKLSLSVPFSRTSLSAQASFEVRSPKRLQVRFKEGAISTPQLLEDVELPESVSVLGQNVDLAPLKQALQPVSAQLKDAVSSVAKFVQSQPDLSFPIDNAAAQTWLINTYLDEDTRITRGDGGSVFVLVKEVSITALPVEADSVIPPPPTTTLPPAASPIDLSGQFDE